MDAARGLYMSIMVCDEGPAPGVLVPDMMGCVNGSKG